MGLSGYVLDQHTAFVRIPRLRNYWVKVHPCVVLVPCGFCGARSGEPCMGQSSYTASHHVARAKHNRLRAKLFHRLVRT